MILYTVDEIRNQLEAWVGNISYHLENETYPQDDVVYERARLDCYTSILDMIKEIR